MKKTLLGVLAIATVLITTSCSMLGGEQKTAPVSSAAPTQTITQTITPPVTVTVTETATPQAQPAAQCGNTNARDNVAANLYTLQPTGLLWTDMGADYIGYDDCLPLSYAVVSVVGATGSSPWHIMLFHYGQYLGTATAQPRAYYPQINRLNAQAIDVGYHLDPNGSDLMYAQFTWSDAQNKVVMTGSVPDL